MHSTDQSIVRFSPDTDWIKLHFHRISINEEFIQVEEEMFSIRVRSQEAHLILLNLRLAKLNHGDEGVLNELRAIYRDSRRQ